MMSASKGIGPHLCLVADVLHFNDGQGRVNYEVAKAVLAAGYRLTMVARVCAEDLAQHPQARWVATGNTKLPTQLARNLYFARKSAAWLRQHRGEFDVIQANGFVTWEPVDIVAVHFVHEAWLKNRFFPFQWGSLSPYQWYQRGLTIMNSRFERTAFTTAKQLIAVSRATAKEVEDLGIAASKLRVIYNGVDTSEFHPPTLATPCQRATFGLPEGVPLALFVGDIRTSRKNLEAILTALVSLPGVHLAVAGAVENSPYPEQARWLGLGSRVHFIGKTSRISTLMRSVDLFVMPSRYETFGMVVLEAMASALPVILSARVGAVEFVGDICRVVEDPDDTVGLTAAMRDLMADPAARARIGDAGRARALEVQWSRTSGAYLDLYDEFVTQKQKGTKV
jgi:glycosyltransferase involved in cell wall biosynthesis